MAENRATVPSSLSATASLVSLEARGQAEKLGYSGLPNKSKQDWVKETSFLSLSCTSVHLV